MVLKLFCVLIVMVVFAVALVFPIRQDRGK
jgi:hypothetical protein